MSRMWMGSLLPNLSSGTIHSMFPLHLFLSALGIAFFSGCGGKTHETNLSSADKHPSYILLVTNGVPYQQLLDEFGEPYTHEIGGGTTYVNFSTSGFSGFPSNVIGFSGKMVSNRVWSIAYSYGPHLQNSLKRKDFQDLSFPIVTFQFGNSESNWVRVNEPMYPIAATTNASGQLFITKAEMFPGDEDLESLKNASRIYKGKSLRISIGTKIVSNWDVPDPISEGRIEIGFLPPGLTREEILVSRSSEKQETITK